MRIAILTASLLLLAWLAISQKDTTHNPQKTECEAPASPLC